jgi:hypothetical protein
VAQPTLVAVAVTPDFTPGVIARTAGSFTWVAGDRFFVLGLTEDDSHTLTLPTVTGLTFSQVVSVSSVNNSRVYLWAATAGGSGSGTITSNASSASTAAGLVAYQYRNCNGLGTPVQLLGSANKTISVTRGQDNSHILLGMVDWNAVNDVAVDPTPAGGTQRVARFETGQGTFFGFDWGDQGATGTTSYGITNHTGTVDMTGLAVEVLGVADQTISPSGQDSAAVYGSHVIELATPQAIAPSGRASAAVYGDHSVSAIVQQILHESVTSSAVYGSHTVAVKGGGSAVVFSDDFNREDGPIDGTSWDAVGDADWVIASNQAAKIDNVVGWLITRTTVQPALADVRVTVTRTSGAGFEGGVIAREQGDTTAGNNGTSYMLYMSGTNDIGVYRRIAGTSTLLQGFTQAHDAGDVYTLGVEGSGETVTLRAYRNGVQLGSDILDTHEDRIVNPGQTGLVAVGSVLTFDDFSVEQLNVVAADIIATGIGTASVYGDLVVANDVPQDVLASGIASFVVYGDHTLEVVEQTVLPVGLDSAAVYGSHILAMEDADTLVVPGVSSAAVYGSHTAAQVVQSISPNGIASAATYGSPTISLTLEQISPSGIASAAAFGSHVVVHEVDSEGIPSAAVYGTHQVANHAAQTISLAGVASAAAFGSHTFANVAARTISVTGIPSAAVYGTHALSGAANTLLMSGVASAAVYGDQLFAHLVLTVNPDGIASAALYGQHILSSAETTLINPTGIASASLVGTPVFANVNAQSIALTGIASAADYGTLTLTSNIISLVEVVELTAEYTLRIRLTGETEAN